MHIFSRSLEFGKIHSREPFHTPRGSQAPHTSFQRQTHSDACYLAPSYDSLEAENYDWQLLCPPTPACPSWYRKPLIVSVAAPGLLHTYQVLLPE